MSGTWIKPGSFTDYARKRMLEQLGVPSTPPVLQESLRIREVIFNDPATIIIWSDGTKTVVKCQQGDEYDPERGFLLCVAKRMFGNRGRYNDIMRYWMPWLED